MQIRFSSETPYGIYSDALNLPDDHEFSESEIQAMQQQRIDAWVAMIDLANQTAETAPSDPITDATGGTTE